MTTNDDHQLKSILEKVTAESQDGLDPDAQGLRETWIQFGRLIEAAQADLPPVVMEMPEDDPYYAPVFANDEQPATCCGATSRRRSDWAVTAAIMVAASLLICIPTAWILSRGEPMSVDVSTQEQQLAVDRNSATTTLETIEPSATAMPEWDDGWDEQITETSRQMLYAQQDVYSANEMNSLQYGIGRMQEELDANSF